MKRNVDVVKAFVAILSAALFSVIFAMLASCTDNSGSGVTLVKKTAKLQLAIVGTSSTPQSRANSPLPSKEDEAKINTLVIGVFNEDGSVNSISEFKPESNEEVAEMDCAPGHCNVIVVANAPERTFENVQTKAEFLGKTVDLSKTATNDVQVPTNLPMSGQGTATLAANATTPVTISLTRLVARISVSSIKTAFKAGSDNARATFKLDKIFLCNVLSSSRIAPGDVTTTFPVTPTWLNDDGIVSGEGTWTGERFLMNEITPVTPVVLSGEGVNEYLYSNWYYAFANNDEQHRTKLVISGWYDVDGAGSDAPSYVYYPIVVNQAQLGTEFEGNAGDAHNGTISRNRDYRLKATIAKKGVESPKEDIGVAEMQLTVTVDNWKLEIIQDVVIE